jgi:hypothetical protein
LGLHARRQIAVLIDRGVFDLIPYNNNEHAGIKIFKSRIVIETKGKTTDGLYEKSRQVIQDYNMEKQKSAASAASEDDFVALNQEQYPPTTPTSRRETIIST